MDITAFRAALARPPEDPASLHPALLSAIYLVAVCVVGGPAYAWKDHFVRETFRQLNISLQNADRLTHFLWASVVFGSFLTNSGRMAEAYAVVSACARFAIACGLDGITDLNRSSVPTIPLLPPPANKAEADDRVRLSRAIYMTDRTLSMLSGLPSVYRTSPAIKGRPNPSIVTLEEHSQQGGADVRMRQWLKYFIMN